MKETYDLNELSLMTGLTTRTLRNYLQQGYLHGEKLDGAWCFTPEELDRFFNDPFVKESIRIKRNANVFDFLAAPRPDRSCVILDVAADLIQNNSLSAFFCKQMEEAHDVIFTLDHLKGLCRIILTGAAQEIEKILKAYYAWNEK